MRHFLLAAGCAAVLFGCGQMPQGQQRAVTPANEMPSVRQASLAISPTTEPAREQPTKTAGTLETVAMLSGPMPTGIAVSRDGREFLCFPRMVDDAVAMSMGELKNGVPAPYPDTVLNKFDRSLPQDAFVCVQSVVVDAQNRLWVLDPAAPLMKQIIPGGPKLMRVDLANNAITRTFPIPPDVALPTSYLNDVRFELRHGHEGMAFITDSSADGPNGIIVVDLDSGKSWRRLSDHPSTKAQPNFVAMFEGQRLMIRDPGKASKPLAIGTDGIAISADGKTLYYAPLCGHHLYSVSVDALADPATTDASIAATVKDLGDRGYASDGLETDAANNLYLTDYEHNAIHRRTPAGVDTVLVSGPQLVWPDSMAIGMDGYLYFTCSQVGRQPRFHDGVDQRKPPYGVYRVRIGEHPSGLE